MLNRKSFLLIIWFVIFAFPSCKNREANISALYSENAITIIGSPEQEEAQEWNDAEEKTVTIVGTPNSGSSTSELGNIPEQYLPSPLQNVPEQILHRKGYTVSYNRETMQPNWVAWYLTAEHTDGVYARPSGNAFHVDLDVPEPRADNADYKGSGWSRGHMCPAGDNKWNDEAMYESFLLTNICPQHDRLNSGNWNDIEQECRRWAKQYGGIYIVCGPIFYRQEHETIGNNKIPVPEAFFKVVLCLNGPPKGIGFICKNTEGNRKIDFYVNSINQVERITGLQLFSDLPDNIQLVVKKMASLQDW